MTTISGCHLTGHYLELVQSRLNKMYEEEHVHVRSLLIQAEKVPAERPHMMLRSCYLLECGSIALCDTVDRCVLGEDVRSILRFARGPMEWSLEGIARAREELQAFNEEMLLYYSSMTLGGEVSSVGNAETFTSVHGSGYKPAADISSKLSELHDTVAHVLAGGEDYIAVAVAAHALLHKAATPPQYQIGVAERLLQVTPENVLTPWPTTL